MDDRRNDRRDYKDRRTGERREDETGHEGEDKRKGDRRDSTDRREE